MAADSCFAPSSFRGSTSFRLGLGSCFELGLGLGLARGWASLSALAAFFGSAGASAGASDAPSAWALAAAAALMISWASALAFALA